MRTIITEFKRMFFEKKLIWLTVFTVTYVIACSLFFWLRFKLDYGYSEYCTEMSAFYLWQMNMNESFVSALMKIIPSMVFVFSYIDDRKNGIDNQICIRSHSNIYYAVKYITVAAGGMIYNFLSIVLIYFSLYFTLSTGDNGWNYLDRANTLISGFFNGNTAIQFVLLIAAGYAFIGGICAAMSYVISMWIDNRVLICIMPYIIFHTLGDILNREKMSLLANITVGNIDVCMCDKPFMYYIYYFVWWIFLLSILFTISYAINIKKKR